MSTEIPWMPAVLSSSWFANLLGVLPQQAEKLI